MLSLEESLKILKETNAVIEGHFILSSGLHSPKYVQCAQLMSKPSQALRICESLAKKIKIELDEFDLILSPAMGGIIVGYELGRLLNKETIFSERIDGEFKLRRDFKIKKGSKVLIVEDVITTGKSSLECSKLVLSNDAIIVGRTVTISKNSLFEGDLVVYADRLVLDGRVDKDFKFIGGNLEINNIVKEPSAEKVLNDLRLELDKWIQKTNDKGAFPESKKDVNYELNFMQKSYKMKMQNKGVPPDISDEDFLKWWEKKLF